MLFHYRPKSRQGMQEILQFLGRKQKVAIMFVGDGDEPAENPRA